MNKECKICQYLWNNLIAIDQLFNTIFGGAPDETISSRSGKMQDKRWYFKALCMFLNLFETEHCKKSIEKDEGDTGVVE